MSMLSAAFLVVIAAVVVFFWVRLRSNLQDIRSLQANRPNAGDSEIALADFPDGDSQKHCGHDAGHHGSDGSHHSVDFAHVFDGGHFDGGGHH